ARSGTGLPLRPAQRVTHRRGRLPDAARPGTPRSLRALGDTRRAGQGARHSLGVEQPVKEYSAYYPDEPRTLYDELTSNDVELVAQYVTGHERVTAKPVAWPWASSRGPGRRRS